MDHILRTLNKKARTGVWFQDHAPFTLQCIHCGQNLHYQPTNQGLTCQAGHHFDINRQGTYFLAHKSVDDKYDTALFQARRHIIQATSLYQPLHNLLVELITQYIPSGSLTLLDAGGGEGSHLRQISHLLPANIAGTYLNFDLSKQAIQLSSDFNGEMLSCVADLAKLPLPSHSVDCILSILSPANYLEFNRLLKQPGLLIKVVPQATYLREIRDAIQQLRLRPHHTTYQNQEVLDTYHKHFPHSEQYLCHQVCHLNDCELQQLVQMTPLTWSLTSAEKNILLNHLTCQITVDFMVLVAQK